MGIINGLGYEEDNEPKFGLRGPAGRDAILPIGLLLDSHVFMKSDIDMNLHQIKRIKLPSTALDDCGY